MFKPTLSSVFLEEKSKFHLKNVECETLTSAFSKRKLYLIDDLSYVDPERLFGGWAVIFFLRRKGREGGGLLCCNVSKRIKK